MSSSNDKYVFSTVHDAVAADADTTTDDSDNSGGVKGPVVPETKGNDEDDDAMVDEKNKSGADDASEMGGGHKVIVGGGEVVGQEKKGDNDDVVVAATVPETKDNVDVADATVDDDVADAMVDEKKTSSVDDVSAKEFDSNEIDCMQNCMRRSLLSRQYKEVWGVAHRSQSSASENPDTASDVTANVDKADVGSVDKDKTENDDVDEEEDTNKDVEVRRDDDSSYVPGISLGDNDEDKDDAVGGINDNADDVDEDEAVEDVIVAEDEVVGVENCTKKQKLHYTHGSIITTRWCHSIIPMVIALPNATLLQRKAASWAIGCMTSAKSSRQEHCQMIE
jgi:hypothetical protein